MVPTTGFAPVRPFGHQALNLARLLFHHAGDLWCAQKDLHLHTFRYTGLSRARLLFHHERKIGTRRGIRTHH